MRGQRRRRVRRRVALDEGLGGHRQSRDPARDVEVVDDVAVVILIHPHPGRRRGAETEAHATLAALAARLHARFHDAFADGPLVRKLGDVANGVQHGQAGNAVSMGYMT